jgi:hypothetical protein
MSRETERLRLVDYLEELTPQEIRLHMGEMSAQEMRTILAFIHWQGWRLSQGALQRPRKGKEARVDLNPPSGG